MPMAKCSRAIREAFTVSDTKRRSSLRNGAISAAIQRKPMKFRSSAREAAAPADFDPATWFAVVEAQKLAIALAAGVDPSKVRIRIGH